MDSLNTNEKEYVQNITEIALQVPKELRDKFTNDMHCVLFGYQAGYAGASDNRKVS